MISAVRAQLLADRIRASQDIGRTAMTGTREHFAEAIKRCEEVRKQLARIEETF